GLHPAEGLISSELEFSHLRLGKGTYSGLECRPRYCAHLEGESNRVRGRSIRGGHDHCGAGELSSIEIRGQRDDQNRLQRAQERAVLQYNDGRPPGWPRGPVPPEVCPPALAPLQALPWWSRSPPHSPSPPVESASSSAAAAPKRPKSQRAASGCRITMTAT